MMPSALVGWNTSRAEGERAWIDEARRCFEQLDVLRLFSALPLFHSHTSL